MKRLLKFVGIAVISISMLTVLNACDPYLFGAIAGAVIEDAFIEDVVVDYPVQGYFFYDGHYHRNSWDYNYNHMYQRNRHNQHHR
jgi:hypothetical protein